MTQVTELRFCPAHPIKGPEEWRSVSSWRNYEVSNYGFVRNSITKAAKELIVVGR